MLHIHTDYRLNLQVKLDKGRNTLLSCDKHAVPRKAWQLQDAVHYTTQTLKNVAAVEELTPAKKVGHTPDIERWSLSAR